MTRRRIAVTGVGMTTALGNDAKSTFARVLRGERGFSDITLFDTTGQRTRFAAEVPGFRVEDVAPRTAATRWSRTDALALSAARDALRAAGLESMNRATRLGVVVGVTTGGMLEAEGLLPGIQEVSASSRSAERFVSYPLSATADRLSETLGPAARVATVCSACSSGANAIVQGAIWLSLDQAEVVIAGADALCRLTLTGFNALGATDLVPCRPFDRSRAGLTLGEGAAFLVLETEERALARGAPVLAWLSGWSVGAEAHHITQPEPEGRLPARLLRSAIASAGLSPDQIDYVNAHGTGTVSNDVVEALGIHTAFGPQASRVLVSSSKGQLGHTLGASSALEAAITTLSLVHQEVPPTAGLTEPDDRCRLNHVIGRGRAVPLRAAASSAFGFGGTGAVLVFERGDAPSRAAKAAEVHRVVVTGASVIGPRGALEGRDVAAALDPTDGDPPSRVALRLLDLLDPSRSRRFDAQACLVTAGVEAAMHSAGVSPAEYGLVGGTAFGNVERTVAFLRAAAEKGPKRAPPAEFPHLVPSAATGNASIYLGLSGPVLATSHLDATAETAVALSCDWIEAGAHPGMVAGGAEPFDALVDELLGPLCEGNVAVARTEGAAWLVLESAARASARGARPLAVVHRRYEVPRDALDALVIEGPRDVARAFVASSRDAEWLASLLARSGWSGAPRHTVGPFAGWHEGTGGIAIAAAAAKIALGAAVDALVVGWAASRVFVFHLRDPS